MTPAREAIGLGLMCKPPRPGTSKTRLAAGVGNDAAAQLSAAFLADCATAARVAAQRSALERVAFYRPRDAIEEIAAIVGPDWPLVFADHGALGVTMREALGCLLASCPLGAMIMGADIPLIGADVIDSAARHLRDGSDRSVVIAPSVDGGYCLIGIRCLASAAPLFRETAWSTPGVLAETLARAGDAGLDVRLLPMQQDIDELRDLHWLRDRLAVEPGGADATREVMRTLAMPSCA